MIYSQFVKQINESKETWISFGRTVVLKENGDLYIDGKETGQNFGDDLSAAKDWAKQDYVAEQIKAEVVEEVYEANQNKLARIIIENTDHEKVTDTLLEHYIEEAKKKNFTVDKAVLEIRRFNKFDRIIENKIAFVLDDGSTVLVSKQTQSKLNNLLKDSNDIVEHMQQSKDNFMFVIEKII